MEIIGIIAEYNPFHKGHLYQINKIKELYPESIIIVITSSSFCQRGEISILNKWDKTAIALENKIDLVQQLVADTYNITIDDLKSKKRNANIAVPRQVAMYICRVVCEESFPKIGMEFGGKDHTTVMHSVDKIKKAIKKDSNLELIIKKIESQLK